MAHSHKDTLPWYKQPLVWMLICIPGMAVVMGVVIINLAIISNDGLVTDDYYKKGLEINRVKKRDHQAEQHHLTARVRMDKQLGMLSIDLNADSSFEFPAQILVDFQHSTRAGFDASLIIDQSRPGIYETLLPQLQFGRWNLQISAADWRLVESLTISP